MKELQTSPNLGQRGFAAFIDYGLYFGLSYFYYYTFGEPNETGGYHMSGFAALLPFFFWFLYFPFIESFGGQTLGKRIVGIQVTKPNGSDITFTDSLKRRLLDWIDISFMGIPALIVIKTTKKHQRLGDLWADTIVIADHPVNCQDCHEQVYLEPHEQRMGKFTCPYCGHKNELK